jgi:pathogenesis-related protein 1
MSVDGGSTTDESGWLDPQNVARMAVGEQPLTWDPIAAQVAQAWANKCTWMHNPDASAEYDALGGSGGLGENIAAGAPSETVAGAVASWVNEEANYTHATNTCASGQVCGHYTQIVWSTTTGVGCGQATCTTCNPFAGYKTWTMSVCDYSPPGNVNGNPPY